MDLIKTKENFKTQLTNVKEKIVDLQEQLEQAKEYKLKLIGGLETLELLEKESELIE